MNTKADVFVVLFARCASFALIATASLTISCSARAPEPEFALIYNRAAQHHGPDRNPIIAIPGILGSKLVDGTTRELAWGAFEPGAADPTDPAGARLLALPIGEGELDSLVDNVKPDGVLESVRVRMLGVGLDIQAYAGILATLGAGGYRDSALGLGGEVDYGDEHFTCFQFDYDWRRDNVENAKRLQKFIEDKRSYVRAEYLKRYGIDKPDIKFDIVAHSMGGLLTRYFLRYGDQDLPSDGSLPELNWGGARYVERAILVGSPNAGSVDAIAQLVNGKRIGPLLPYYPSSLLGTFPSVYQLLPRPRHHAVLWNGDPATPVEDVYDAALWERMGWGLFADSADAMLDVLLPGLDEGRRIQLIRLYERRVLARAKAFHHALDRDARPPEGLELFLVAGDVKGTPSQVSVDPANGAIAITKTAPGDGVVLRSSVLLDERVSGQWSHQLVSPIEFSGTLFVEGSHLGLTNNPVFRDNVLFWLLEDPR